MYILKFIRLLRVVFSSQQRLNRPAVNAIQWRHYSLAFALIHAKTKTRFSSDKPRNIVWKCLHGTELLYFFDRSSCLTFKPYQPHAVQLWRSGYTEFYYQTRSQSRNEINTHTEHLVQKHNDLLKNWKKAIWSLTKKKTRKQERKAKRIITLDGKNSKKVEL